MKRWSILVALAAGTTSALLCWKVLGLIPHVPDEVSYVFQGRIFAAAKLWLSPPSVPEAFAVEHIVMTPDRWCSIYPPGWPFLLAIGWLFHAPWLVNPVLLALSVIGVWKLGSILYDDRTGILGAIFFVVSPFVLLMGAGFMAHVPELCCIIWCFVLIAKNGDHRTSFLAGLLGGFAFLIRPYTAIPLLLPALVWQPGLEKKKRTQTFFAFSFGFLPFLLLFLVYNQLVFGGPFRTGYDLDPFWPSTHFSVREFLKNLSWYVETSSKYLWGWPFPDLLIFLPLLRPRIQWQKDLMLAACCMSLLGAYCFFSYHDIVYAGPRFLFEMMGFLSLLVVRSILSIYDLVRNYRIATVALKVIVLFLIVFPLMIRLPYQIQYHSQIYHGQYRSGDQDGGKCWNWKERVGVDFRQSLYFSFVLFSKRAYSFLGRPGLCT